MAKKKDKKMSEGQAGFRPNRSRVLVDHVYTLSEIILGRKDAGLSAYSSFFRCAECLQHSIEKRVAGNAVGK